MGLGESQKDDGLIFGKPPHGSLWSCGAYGLLLEAMVKLGGVTPGPSGATWRRLGF
jgi:hypothetical protein